VPLRFVRKKGKVIWFFRFFEVHGDVLEVESSPEKDRRAVHAYLRADAPQHTARMPQGISSMNERGGQNFDDSGGESPELSEDEGAEPTAEEIETTRKVLRFHLSQKEGNRSYRSTFANGKPMTLLQVHRNTSGKRARLPSNFVKELASELVNRDP
jgi:hypothetical protein